MEEAFWTYAAGINRWALYGASLLAAGSALFLLLIRATASGRKAATTAGMVSSCVAGLAFVLSIGLGGADMLTGPLSILLSAEAWDMGLDSSLGRSAGLGLAGAGLLVAGFRTQSRAALAAGAVAMIGSFPLTGHAAASKPAWVMQAMVAAHMAGAAFWLGALIPLYRTARTDPPAQAGVVMVDFSRRAVWLVALLTASGVEMAVVQLRRPEALFASDYGWRLVIKLGLFAALLGLAAYNKFGLTPRLATDDGHSAAALRRSIVWEHLLFVLILGAAAALSASAPPGNHSTPSAEHGSFSQLGKCWERKSRSG